MIDVIFVIELCTLLSGPLSATNVTIHVAIEHERISSYVLPGYITVLQ